MISFVNKRSIGKHQTKCLPYVKSKQWQSLQPFDSLVSNEARRPSGSSDKACIPSLFGIDNKLQTYFNSKIKDICLALTYEISMKT